MIRSRFLRLIGSAAAPAVLCLAGLHSPAGENEPRRPFAQWAVLPQPGQWLFGTFYEQFEAYHIWQQGNNRVAVNTRVNGENYGIDVRQGYFTLDYGIMENGLRM